MEWEQMSIVSIPVIIDFKTTAVTIRILIPQRVL